MAKLFIGDLVLGKEVCQTKNPKTNLAIQLRCQILTSITNTSLAMKTNQAGHALLKGSYDVVLGASTQVHMLK